MSLGSGALQANTSGNNNTAIGRAAATTNISAHEITAIGYKALYSTTVMSTAVGAYAGYTNSTGLGNSYFGWYAGKLNATSAYNTYLGYYAGNANTGGSNTIVGSNAFVAAGAGVENTGVGNYTLAAVTSGNYNTALGYGSGYTNSTGSGNIFIGYSAGFSETGSNTLYIDNSNTATPLIKGDFNSDTLRINGDLKVSGQITFAYKHLVAYLTGGSYTPNVVSNTPFKLAPGTTVTENDGLTYAGDTITIITAGDYKLEFAAVLQGSNGDDFKFTVRKNGTEFTSGNAVITTTGAGNYITVNWFYYFPGLAAGDDISFYVTNEGSSNDPTFRAWKVYIKKEME
jgi:hypothetical protein